VNSFLTTAIQFGRGKLTGRIWRERAKGDRLSDKGGIWNYRDAGDGLSNREYIFRRSWGRSTSSHYMKYSVLLPESEILMPVGNRKKSKVTSSIKEVSNLE